MTAVIAAHIPGMMDRSRFPSQAVAPNGPVVFVPDAAALEGLDLQLILVDLDRCTDLASFVAAGAPVIGFGSHVEEATLQAATAAGVDEVLARSVFFKRLPELLQIPGASV